MLAVTNLFCELFWALRGSADDRKNFNELLLAIRVALNEYQTQTGDAPLGSWNAPY